MLFQLLRRYMRKILWVTVIIITPAFVLWGTGTGAGSSIDSAVALQIEGEEISPRAFDLAVQEAARRFGSQNAVTYAMDTLIDDYLIRQACVDLEIYVTNADVQAILKQRPLFQNPDGSFNAERWNKALRSKKSNWESMIGQARRELQRRKVTGLLRSTVQIPPTAVRAQFERDHARRRVAYATFSPSSFAGEMTATDAQVQAYYDDNPTRYRAPDAVRLTLVRWPKEPSEVDKSDVLVLLGDLQQQLSGGVDFGELAEQYSEDTSREQQGDLGWFGRDKMVKPFTDAAFALGVGEVSPPIRTTSGWHLIKVEDRRDGGQGPEVRARHILIREEASLDTLADLHAQATAFADALVGDARLTPAARAAGLTVTQTEPLARTAQTVPGVGAVRQIVAAAFELEAGRHTGVLDLTDAFVIAEVTEHIPSYVPAFAEIRSQVEADYGTSQAGDLAAQRARDVAGSARGLGDLAAVEAGLVGEVVETDLFTRVSFVPNVGRPPAFMDAAFTLEPGAISDPLPHGDRWFVLQVREAVPADPERFETVGTGLRRQLQFERRAQAMEDYLIARKAVLNVRQNPQLIAAYEARL